MMEYNVNKGTTSPDNSNLATSPKTGDAMSVWGMLVISGSVVGTLVYRKKRA